MTAPPRPNSAVSCRLVDWLAVLLVGATALSLCWLIWCLHWSARKPIPPAGGLYFFQRTELLVPHFWQASPLWGLQPLGQTNGTLGEEGCAVASAAMVLASYGIDTDPGRLNQALIQNGGFTPEGWIYWEKAAEIAPDRVRHVYEDLPSYQLIDAQLAKGNPVIVRLRLPIGITHFVVVVGKTGFEYLIRDPFAPEGGVQLLSRFGSRVEALRFYEKL